MKLAGVDCGGTWTRCTLLDNHKTLAHAVTGPSNPASTPPDTVRRNIAACLSLLARAAGVNPEELEAVGVAAPALAGGAWEPLYRQAVHQAAPNARVVVVEDYVAAHHACFQGAPGVVVVSGTGSVAYAVSSRGTEVRVGGWGYLLGDEGSAYHVARQAMEIALRYLEGRAPHTNLLWRLIQYLDAKQPWDIIARVYGAHSPRTLIAGFAPVVVEEAEAGDKVAQEILRQAARSLAELIAAAYQLIGEEQPYCITGGFYNRARRLLAGMVREELEKILGHKPPPEIRPRLAPEEAVARLAAKTLEHQP